VLADKSTELLGLGTLRNGDVVGIAELLELGLAPGIDKLVGESGIRLLGASSGTGLLLLGLEVSETRVAADSGNQLVTSGGLGSRDAMGVEPLLEVGLGPGVVKPVTGIVGSLANLLTDRLPVLTDLGDKGVTLAGLRN
jgi:hypothetical protein